MKKYIVLLILFLENIINVILLNNTITLFGFLSLLIIYSYFIFDLKSNKLFNSKVLYGLISLSFSIFSFFNFLYYYTYESINIYLFIPLLLVIFIFILLFKYRLKNINKIEELFITLLLPLCFIYMMFFLPQQMNDEDSHYTSAYNVYNGDLLDISYHSKVPSYILILNYHYNETYESIIKNYKGDYPYDSKIDGGTTRYFGLFYYPVAISIFICKSLNINFMISYYLGRLFNIIVAIYILYHALKIIPFGKKIFLVLMFNPMFLSSIASVSIDAIILSTIYLYIAYFLKLYKSKNIELYEYTDLFILSCLVGVYKYVYLPLILCNFLLLKKLDKKNKMLFIFLNVFAFIMVIYHYYYVFIINNNPYKHDGVGLFEQVNFIISDFKGFIFILFNYIKNNITKLYFECFGGYLRNTTLVTNKLCIISYTLVLLLVSLIDKKEVDRKCRIVFDILSIIVFFGVILIMYLTFSPIGSNVIYGVQGRYFIPLVPLLLFNLPTIKRKINYNYIYAFLVLINLFEIFQVIEYYI